MGPYETGFFLEACRLRGSSVQPYRPLHPEITGAVRAVSEVLAAEGLPDHARAQLLERIASRIHAMEPEDHGGNPGASPLQRLNACESC